VRGAARGLIVLVTIAGAALPAPGRADVARAIRDLDGGQFLEDEPIWLFDADATAPGGSQGYLDLPYRLVGKDGSGQTFIRLQGARTGPGEPGRRAGELGASLLGAPRPELHPLGPGPMGGLRAGRYEVRPARGDTARILATFRVVEPRGSELAVRAALARAARLASSDGKATPEEQAEARRQAARLCEAVLARYPRTSYRTAAYAMLWRLAGASRYAEDAGRWLDEVFAQFHNTAFGVWALDQFMADARPEHTRPHLRKLVGLYPDTRVSRAAARYL
jgi:hypothetical protein